MMVNVRGRAPPPTPSHTIVTLFFAAFRSQGLPVAVISSESMPFRLRRTHLTTFAALHFVMNINSRKSQKLIRKAVNKALRKHVGELATAIASDVVAGLAVKIADQPKAPKNGVK